ncbi:MAG TPA: peptidase M48, partial [Acidobacteriota bacterium]|nr:peptidase M48 [Acidobacteriota bacterium]
TFFQKLEAKEKEKPGRFSGFFRTHPPVESRIQKVEQEITFLPPKEEYIVSTSEYNRVKSRLIALDNKQLVAGAEGEGSVKRPTLKRKTNTDRSEREEPELQGDRPTLKRPSLKRDGEDN